MPFMKDIFPLNRNPYILRQNSQFSRPCINTVYHGTENISNFGTEYGIWYQVIWNKYETETSSKKH